MIVIDNLIRTTNCCGLRELDGIEGHRVEDIVYTLGHAIENELPRQVGAFFLFTGVEGGVVDELCEWGRTNNDNFGRIITTNYVQNPNSGNMLKVCVWETDDIARDELARFYRENNAPPIDLAVYGLVVGDFISYAGVRGRIRGVNQSRVELEMRNGSRNDVALENITRITKARAYNS